MKEQDAAHSFDEAHYQFNEKMDEVKELVNYALIHANKELTRLRSELEQERELRKELINRLTLMYNDNGSVTDMLNEIDSLIQKYN